MLPQPAVLSGTAFLLADEAGDVPAGGTGGFFLDDTRHLSTWELLVDGRALTVLSAQRGAASGESVLVPRPVRGSDPPFAVLRTQVLDGGALVERLRVRNLGTGPRVVEVRYRVAADFADQLELRGDRTYPKPGSHRAVHSTAARLELEYRREGWRRVTTVRPGPAARCDDEGLTWRVALDAGAEDVLLVRVAAAPSGAGPSGTAPGGTAPDGTAPDGTAPGGAASHGSAPNEDAPDGPTSHGVAPHREPEPGPVERIAARRRARDDAFRAAFALPEIADPRLERAVRTGIDALAALQIPAPGLEGGHVAGAGAPWFLTLFGRDSLVTALAALPFTATPAETTLRVLAQYQGREHRPERCEEPGKIVHEIRSGELSRFGQVPYARFYGTVDATPLFLVLLGAHHERTGDAAPARELEPAARAAVEWMERDGGLGERGFLVYPTDAPGLVHHGWKDSATAITFASGEPAEGPIAVAEAQGYAVDALARTARLAREVWHDPAYAARLAGLADDLRRRLTAAFWLPEADFPALALDGRGRRVDLLASNAGHLLWSGALDARQAGAVAERLVAPEFASGWGLRTVAAGQPTYHPISYHQGSVWPHDTAIAVAGLARYGFADHARRLADGLLDAAERCGFVLPEVMAGFGADEVTAPVPYPHSCSPQAWAAAAPLLLVDALGNA